MSKSTTTYWNPLLPQHADSWTPVAGLEGVAEELTLSLDPEAGEYTRLTRFLPGADTAAFGGKSHAYPEEVFIVSGRLYDQAFDLWLEPGHYASRPPGEVHGPFRTDEGCVVLELSFPNRAGEDAWSGRSAPDPARRGTVPEVALREITAATVRRITALVVRPEQQRFVATNAESLAEALFAEEAWYRAIYLGDEPVGFVMLYDESLRADRPAAPQVALWRFMVDARYQGRGIGRLALQRVVERLRRTGAFEDLLVSYVPGAGCPERFYLAAGFEHTGRIEDGEVVLRLRL